MRALTLLALVLAGCSDATDTERAMIYACGYQHGQRAVIESARLADVPVPPSRIECERYADIAVTFGFSVAGKNR